MVFLEDREILAQLPGLLLPWYDGGARVLPWREEPTPYRVWVSEIMLQQTRVEAVRPYYERFLEAFPTVEALAAAPEEKLLKDVGGPGLLQPGQEPPAGGPAGGGALRWGGARLL